MWLKELTIKNFNHSSAECAAYSMMATTWFHEQRKEWDFVNNINKTSGEIFTKDFPDARH
jgi:hypothetical protein